MLTHIVCWKYKPGISTDQRSDHIAKLRALADVIPNIEHFNVGADILHLERSFDTGLVAVFKCRAELDAYDDHPEHQKVAAIGKQMEPENPLLRSIYERLFNELHIRARVFNLLNTGLKHIEHPDH